MSEAKKVGYMFTVNHTVSDTSNIQVNGNFAMDATSAEMTAEFNKLYDALDMQHLKRYQIPQAKNAIDMVVMKIVGEERAIADGMASLEELNTKERLTPRDKSLTENVKASLENHGKNLVIFTEEKKRLEHMFSELEKKAA